MHSGMGCGAGVSKASASIFAAEGALRDQSAFFVALSVLRRGRAAMGALPFKRCACFFSENTAPVEWPGFCAIMLPSALSPDNIVNPARVSSEGIVLRVEVRLRRWSVPRGFRPSWICNKSAGRLGSNPSYSDESSVM